MAVMERLVRGPDRDQPVPEGSVIFCPGCGSGLFSVTQPLHLQLIRLCVSCFEPLTEHELHDRDIPLICPECSRLIIGPLGRFWYRPPRIFSSI